MATKIISYNVNGLRAAERKGFSDWLKAEDPDIVCLQETKLKPRQVPQSVRDLKDYDQFWYSAQKPGYSGVAILTKKSPKHVEYGMNHELYDAEGRVIRADYDNFSILSLYLPSGSSGEMRQEFKEQFMRDFIRYLTELKRELPNLIVSGDFNICHQAIDIHDPKRNARVSGFLPQEREWFGELLDEGWVDSFRHLHHEARDHYSWWSYRAGARKRNKGWRLDYHLVSSPLRDQIISAGIQSQVIHSDHCPVVLEIAD